MSADTDLPTSWARATLPELVAADGFVTDGDWVESKDQDPEGEVRLTQLADVGDGEFRDRSHRFLTLERAGELRCTFLAQGDLMIARMPDPLGRACIFPGSHQKCVTAVDVCIVRPGSNGVNNRWLMHFVNSPAFRSSVASLQSGSTRKRISKKNLCTLEVPVPAREEQDRIASDLDSYLSRLDDAVAGLERVRRNLERYRASVLQAAVEGRLVPTEAELARAEGRDYEPAFELLKRILAERRCRWEEVELNKLKTSGKPPAKDGWKKKYKEPTPPDTKGLPELPEGWCWATLAQLSWDSSYGTSRRCSYDGAGEPVLRIPNVQNGALVLDDLKRATVPLEVRDEDLLAPGDFLVIRTNGSRNLIARAALVRDRLSSPHFFASYLIRFRLVLRREVGPWLLALWHSPEMRRQLEREAATSAGQYNVSQTVLLKKCFPLPPAAEQERLAAQVEHMISVADAVELSVSEDLARSARLKQSVLSWAFEGRLVDQDPKDEPSAALLARIGSLRVAGAENRPRRPAGGRRGVTGSDTSTSERRARRRGGK